MADKDAALLGHDLAGLIRHPAQATLRDLWAALSHEDSRSAVRAALEAGDSLIRDWAVTEVARQRHFRRKTVESWGTEKLADAAAYLRPRDTSVLRSLLVAFHTHERADLLESYLDFLGVKHVGGLVKDEDDISVGRDEAAEATRSLLESFPPDHVALYLLSLALITPALGPQLGEWLPEQFRVPEGAGESVLPTDETDVVPEEGGTPSPEQTDEFTTLDQQLVRAIVDAAQGVEGALDRDQLDDLIGELIELNSSRHRSFFHLGFSDVVLQRESRQDLPAQNESRRRWYWAGYVTGLARGDEWERIVELFDQEPSLSALGSSGRGPASTAARLIFDALCRAERQSEGATFLSPDALVENRQLAVLVHDEARKLLWQDRAAEARALMDLLGQLLIELQAQGFNTSTRFLLEMRRRRAHCFRQLGELAKAKEILEELLELESDPDIRAMVLADLGLIEGGFRSLASVLLPADAEKVGEVRSALEQGEELYRQADELDTRYSAHGQFCLGVMAMARDEWDEAARSLELAQSVFESEPARYESGRLLARVRLYLGMALACNLDLVRHDRAVELLEEGISDGVAVPSYLASQMIEALQIESEDGARLIAETLLDHSPELLDDLVGSGIADKSHAVTDALLERSADADLPATKRAEDMRRSVAALLFQGRTDRAGAILDDLEQMAHDDVGRAEFLEFLETSDSYDPAWTPEDAVWCRVNLLGASGRGDEAVALLEEEFYRVLHSNRFEALDEADGVLAAIRTFGASADQSSRLEVALESARPEQEAEDDDDEAEILGEVIKVLFVGGDERQERDAEQISEELKESHPHIRVDFVHPGWSGNWGGTLDDLKERLGRYDALVIMRFIRTEFGKQLRKAIDVPWVPCTTSGRSRMRRSILRAAKWGRRAGGLD